MMIWRGKGFAIGVIAFACLVIAELSIETIAADDRYYQAHGWPKLIGF